MDDLYVSLPESIAVSKKTLQRNETYITAVSVILSEIFKFEKFIDGAVMRWLYIQDWIDSEKITTK